MNRLNLDELIVMACLPDDQADYTNWLKQDEVIGFFEREAREENIIIYASLPRFFLHGIFVPQFDVTEEATRQLCQWNFNVCNQWSVVGWKDRFTIEGPLASTGIPLIEAGEQIVFVRSFDGYKPKSTDYELNQKIGHVLRIHQLEERAAWCDLDEFGDVDEIVKVHSLKQIQGNQGGTVISMRKERLAEFAAAGGYCLLRMFDVTRFRPNGFAGWGPRASGH